MITEWFKRISENTLMQSISNYRDFVDMNVVDTVLDYWPLRLADRKSKLEFLQNDDAITDLDLVSVFRCLVRDNSVIEIPHYERMKAKQLTENQIRTKSGQIGKCVSLTSHQKYFSFSVRCVNDNIIAKNEKGVVEQGAYRTYSLTDMVGNLYHGWGVIKLHGNVDYKEYLIKNFGENYPKLLVFKKFVNDSRWVSFYSIYHFMAKCLIERLSAEQSILRKKKKELLDRGILLPEWGGKLKENEWPAKHVVGETKNIDIPCFESEVDFPTTFSDFETKLPTDGVACLRFVIDRLDVTGDKLEDLRLFTRVNEYAFSRKHPADVQKHIFPSYYVNPDESLWVKNHRVSAKSKTDWNCLTFAEDATKSKYNLRYRWITRSIPVDKDYELSATD